MSGGRGRLDPEGSASEKPAELTPEEIEAQSAEELPDREAMSLLDANVAIPVNAAVAANVLADNSAADAAASEEDKPAP